MLNVRLTVNGREASARIDERTLLVSFLRDHLNLTGTRIGCDTSQCGCCTVLLNGRSVKSCTVLAAQAEGADVQTVEGLAPEGRLHPLQQAFRDHHALQCGFCTAGFLMRAAELVRTQPDADEAAVRAALDGNLCRCTGYENIVKAILSCTAESGTGGHSGTNR